MKKMVSLLLVLGLFVVASGGTASAAWFWKKSKAHAVKTITKEELSAKIASGSVQIVNVLSPDYYNLGVIKGSKKIPLNELDKRIRELDKTKDVVTYCANYQCTASDAAAEKLAKRGFNVSAYKGGAKEWKDSGLPLEA